MRIGVIDMSRRRCCCGCRVWVNDEFDRADSTKLGEDWEEVVGDWEIQTGHLVPVLLDPTAIVLTTSRNPSRRGVTYGGFTLLGAGPWQIRFLLNSNADATSFQFVDFSCDELECTLTAGTVGKSYDTDVGLNGDLVECKPGPWVWNGASGEEFYFQACLVEGLLHFWVVGQTTVPPTYRQFSGCVWDIDITLNSLGNGYAGIQVLSGGVKFDRVVYTSHDRDSPEPDPNCPDCSCLCGAVGSSEGYGYMPFRVRFDFFADADCPCIDGGYLIFEPMMCGVELNALEAWVCVEADLCGGNHTWHTSGPGDAARLDCRDSTEGNFAVIITICQADITPPTSIDCSPFSMRYDWTAPAEGCDECDPSATFYAIATEG